MFLYTILFSEMKQVCPALMYINDEEKFEISYL